MSLLVRLRTRDLRIIRVHSVANIAIRRLMLDF